MDSTGPENAGPLHNCFAFVLCYPGIPSRLLFTPPCFPRTGPICRLSLHISNGERTARPPRCKTWV